MEQLKKEIDQLVLLSGLLFARPSYAQSEDVFLGDVNGTGQITTYDLILIRNYILGNAPLTCMEWLRADVNGDRKVTTVDMIEIRKYILNLHRFLDLLVSVKGLAMLMKMGKLVQSM